MVPQMAPNYFRSFSRRLQHWIRGRTPRPPSATCPSGTLHHQHILGGDLILSSWPWLDIQHQALPEQVTFVHERVYWFSLLEYGHSKPTHPQLTPHKHSEIKYESKKQLRHEDGNITNLDATGVKSIQSIIRALLYYARDVDNKILVALSAIGDQQVAFPESTTDSTKQLLDYVSTYPNGGIVYRASEMVLDTHSDTGFHNESKGRSCAGSHIFLYKNDPEPR